MTMTMSEMEKEAKRILSEVSKNSSNLGLLMGRSKKPWFTASQLADHKTNSKGLTSGWIGRMLNNTTGVKVGTNASGKNIYTLR